MTVMPSKELLSEVFNKEVTDIYIEQTTITLRLHYSTIGYRHTTYNIYELTHKHLKSWAIQQGYMLKIHTTFTPSLTYTSATLVDSNYRDIWLPIIDPDKTEEDAVVILCERILEL